MAGGRARDISPAKPISELSKHGMLLQFINAQLRSLPGKLMEERARPHGREEVESQTRSVTQSRCSQCQARRSAASWLKKHPVVLWSPVASRSCVLSIGIEITSAKSFQFSERDHRWSRG